MNRVQEFNFSVNTLSALLWQYDDAPRLSGLIAAKSAWYEENQIKFWSDWQKDVFNLRTANRFGLNVWSYILGMPITISDSVVTPQVTFGYGDEHVGYGRGNFYDPGSIVTLNNDEARAALLIRYRNMTGRQTVTYINETLQDVFGSFGVSYVEDNLNMTMRYVFEWELPAALAYLFDNIDILPSPAGVNTTYIVSP